MEKISKRQVAAAAAPRSINTASIENKIDSILPKQNHAYGHIRNMLLNDISIENANTLCNYIIAMRQESNISESTRRNLLAIIGRFIRSFSLADDKNKSFAEITHNDIVDYTQNLRKSETEDPSQKWIGTYNFVIASLQKFYKWLYYPNVAAEERALPECVTGFRRIKRRELARYAPSDIWTIEEHKIFLKYCPSIRMRAFHANPN